jgi:hypothetical protein
MSRAPIIPLPLAPLRLALFVAASLAISGKSMGRQDELTRRH